MGRLGRIRSRGKRLFGGLAVAGALLFGTLAADPAGQEAIPNPIRPRPAGPFGQEALVDPVIAGRQLRVLNAQRQKSMVSDTQKLLKLAQELNAEIQTANPDTEIRKISDIEKLARNVKQKMSTSLVGGPSFHDPIDPAFR